MGREAKQEHQGTASELKARIKTQIAKKYWNTFAVGQTIEIIDTVYLTRNKRDVKEKRKVTCKIISKNNLYMRIDKNGKMESITFADMITGHAKIRHRLNKTRVLTKDSVKSE
jgi:hypothetical protein